MNAKRLVRKMIGFPNIIYNTLLLKYYHIKHGENFKINGRIHCMSNSSDGIIIGNNVSINSNRGSNPIGGDIKTILFAKGNGKIRIGDGCGISNATLFASESIILGKQVFVGGGVKIYDTDFHWLDFERRVSEPGGAVGAVIIKDGAFIGAHCIILKGVTIGEKSVIGAGSIVTKSVPPGEIWAGNPAKFIRRIESKDVYKKSTETSKTNCT